MKRILTPRLLISAVLLIVAPRAPAQQHRRSPHETVSRKIEGNRMTIVYGRPYTRSPFTGEMRKIWGGLVPFGKIWRVGADEATLMVTQKPIDFGGLSVPAGAYTLFMLPEADGTAQLIVNREIGQWGIDPYHPKNELGRVTVKGGPLSPPVHEFTIELAPGKPSGGVLDLMWEDRQFVIPYHVSR